MNLYTVASDYLSYLRKKYERILKNQFSGMIIRLEGFIYYIPLMPLSASDYEENLRLRRSTPTVLRLVSDEKPILKVMLSNMFPVPYKAICKLDLNDDHDEIYKRIDVIEQNQKRITKAAKRLYKQKLKGYQQSYLEVTLDFQALEKDCVEWEKSHYGKHYNRYPDASYFIENPHRDGLSQYYLMNKNKKIALVTLDNQTQNFISLDEMLDVNYAPLECFDHHQLTAQAITKWFKGRGIPSWRDGLDEMLYNMDMKSGLGLLNRAYGLSLTDQYWLSPVSQKLEWKDINFFDHDFSSEDYNEVVFEGQVLNEPINFYSPNNTSDGMLKKSWIVGEDHVRYLLKASYRSGGFEPFCEVLASMVCDALDLDHVPYSIAYIGHTVVSKCPCFINSHTELITAYAILYDADVDLTHQDAKQVYQNYLHILKLHGFKDAEISLSKMLILDYLIMNTDRHLGNFGIIRDVHTLEWCSLAPIFDSGQSMCSQSKVYEIQFERGRGTFFQDHNMDFEEMLSIAFNKEIVIDYKRLENVASKWENLLLENKELAYLDEMRITQCVQGFRRRIQKLKNYHQC